MKALIISADNFEDSELLVPYYRLKEAGIEVAVASISREAIKGMHGYEVAVDKTLNEVNPDDYAILILPGGKAPSLVRNVPVHSMRTRRGLLTPIWSRPGNRPICLLSCERQ